jgi:hypothetical protein
MRILTFGVSFALLMILGPNPSLWAEYSLTINFKKFGEVTVNGVEGRVLRQDTNANFFAPGPHVIPALPDTATFIIEALNQSLSINNAVFNNGLAFELGQDLTFDLDVTLGSVFKDWEGSAANSTGIGGGAPSPELSIAKPLGGNTTEAIAVFDYGFTNAKFTFNNQNSSVFTVNSTSGVLTWSQIQNLLVPGTNNVLVEVNDKFGSTSTNFTFDSFSPTSAVPEPNSFILLSVAAGAGAVGRRFWKKRKVAC